MKSTSPRSVPYSSTAAIMPPTYVETIPMTVNPQPYPYVHDDAMPYRPRERSMEKAFRQLCCGSCWGFCAWIAGIVALLAGTIVVAVVLVSNSKHSAAVAVAVSSSTSPAPVSSVTISSSVTSFITITTASQQPSISISTSTVTPLQPSTVTKTVSQTSTTTMTATSTSTTTTTYSAPPTQTVTTSVSASTATHPTTLAVNVGPNKVVLVPSCFQEWIDTARPGLFTGQPYTEIGAHSTTTVSTTGVVEFRSSTGLVLAHSTTVWPACGEYILSFSYPSTSSTSSKRDPSTKSPAVRTVYGSKTTTTTTPVQRYVRSDLAVEPRQAPDAIPITQESQSKPLITRTVSSGTIPITYTQTLDVGTARRTETTTYRPDVIHYMSTPDWLSKIKRASITDRHQPNTELSARGGHASPASAEPTPSTAGNPVTYVQTLTVKGTTRTETMIFTPGVYPYTSTPTWKGTSKPNRIPRSVSVPLADNHADSTSTTTGILNPKLTPRQMPDHSLADKAPYMNSLLKRDMSKGDIGLTVLACSIAVFCLGMALRGYIKN